MSVEPALILLPNLLGAHPDHRLHLPGSVDEAVAGLDGLIAESERAGRYFLSRFKTKKPARETPIALLNEHSDADDLDFLLEPILNDGERWGLVSDAGLPCVADPGAQLVTRARQRSLTVEAHMGQSSIMLSLMLSGLGGQAFSFLGYVARQPEKREEEIRAIEQQSREHGMTQIFIEAPYRNQATLEALIQVLDPSTRLCVAWDLTLPEQGVISQPVKAWRKTERPDIHKKPATFLLAAPKKVVAKPTLPPAHRKRRFPRR